MVELTKEQKEERSKRKLEAFLKDYQALCLKHGMQHQGFLQYTPQGMIPVSLPVEFKTENYEQGKKQGGTTQ